jgi:DNA-binding NarL/FixJ family response regulator
MVKSTTELAVVKILIVDDHPAVREALAARIALHPDLVVCGEAADVAQTLQLIAQQQPDIIITDITLKTGDGIDLIKRIKAHDANMRILVWSMHSESLYAERALRAGAMGYITKEQATQQIIEAIREILAGKLYLSPAMSEKLVRLSVDGGKNLDRSPIDALTDRELQVFRLIGAGVKTQAIADQLHVSIKTVETHRERIKKKLDLKDANDLVRAAVLWVKENA